MFGDDGYCDACGWHGPGCRCIGYVPRRQLSAAEQDRWLSMARRMGEAAGRRQRKAGLEVLGMEQP